MHPGGTVLWEPGWKWREVNGSVLGSWAFILTAAMQARDIRSTFFQAC